MGFLVNSPTNDYIIHNSLFSTTKILNVSRIAINMRITKL
ncbi:MAG: hypothetical protein BAJALOKI3v1_610005 [Promethearchaeota archaeon]|nr:MAG: hypothetical protein BAJALOKI3v1_610005 [Candidatus Lokiarchaeota archaeon]